MEISPGIVRRRAFCYCFANITRVGRCAGAMGTTPETKAERYTRGLILYYLVRIIIKVFIVFSARETTGGPARPTAPQPTSRARL